MDGSFPRHELAPMWNPRVRRGPRRIRRDGAKSLSGNWLGSRDSNPGSMIQSHVSYRWTTPQHGSSDQSPYSTEALYPSSTHFRQPPQLLEAALDIPLRVNIPLRYRNSTTFWLRVPPLPWRRAK